MTLAAGDRLPDVALTYSAADGPAKMSATEFGAGRKVVIFGVPGAFTPTCHRNHLPGFVDNLDEITAKGVAEVAVISVNDIHVMNAWAQASGGEGKIRFFSDGNGEFVRAAGLDIVLSVAGMGVRSKRFAMIVEDNVVKAINIEESPGQAVASSASAILELL